jgi:hypothetical protein
MYLNFKIRKEFLSALNFIKQNAQNSSLTYVLKRLDLPKLLEEFKIPYQVLLISER